MDSLNGEIKDIFATFNSDLSGIRVKKLLRLVRSVQATIPDLEKLEEKTIHIFENGHSICVSPNDHNWSLQIDEALITLDASNVYDDHGHKAQCKDIAPQVIQTILTAA